MKKSFGKSFHKNWRNHKHYFYLKSLLVEFSEMISKRKEECHKQHVKKLHHPKNSSKTYCSILKMLNNSNFYFDSSFAVQG